MVRPNPWEYTELEFPGQLAYLTVSCTTRCNFQCPYCSKKEFATVDLEHGLLKKALREALDLGLNKVELTGGEALLYPHFWETVDFLTEHKVMVQLVTNASLITEQTAQKLAASKVNVAVSLSTLDAAEFTNLSGRTGKYQKVIEALGHLKRAGCRADQYPMFAVHSLASKKTFHELKALRRFAREKECGFVLNRAIPVGGLTAGNVPAGHDLQDFLDSEFSGRQQALIPFSGDTPCNRLQTGCYIGSDGKVRPCSSIDIVVGDLKTESISAIWKQSEILEQCRTIEQRLEGSCRNCPEHHRCYGCRAAAYAVWGSITAPDPGCFRFREDAKFNKTKLREGVE